MLQEDTAFGGPTAAASFLPLARVEVAQVGSVSSRDTLALLPPGRKGTQKLVVGDDSGQVKAYEVKRGEVSTAFGFDVGGLVRCVVVGMGEDGAPRDKIFATQGASIVGMDRKGREVYRLTSSSSELMTNVVVIGTTIYTCAEFTYNRYDDGVDAAFYMCQDKIMCMEVIRPWNSNEKKAVALGCLDRCIRIIHESDCVAKFSVDAPMRALTSCNGGVAYGTDAGSVGWLSPGTSTSIGESPFELSWCMPGTAAVTCMSTGQLRGGGAVLELLVGREDGTVEFYDLSAQVSTRQPPQVYADNLGDCVRSLAVGFVNSPTYSEALALTYGGRIVSFTTEPLNRVDASDKEGRTLGVLHSTNAMRQLRQDIKVRGTAIMQKIIAGCS
jgi:Bardet-Biedl syndrome 7 protein